MPENLNSILQQQLRDVHLPQDISWWPLALGWWLLIAVFAAAVITGLMYLLRKAKRQRYRAAALKELRECYAIWQNNQNASAYLQTANSILKRCVLRFDQTAAALSGEQWATALNQLTTRPLAENLHRAISTQCYHPDPRVDIDQLQTQISDWIKTHKTPNANLTPPTDEVGYA